MIDHKYNLPKDILKYINKRIARCITTFLVSEIVAIVISILTYDYFTKSINLIFYIIVVIFLCAVPFFVSRFPFKLIDRSWHGVVTDVIVKSETGTYTAAGTKAFPYDKNVIYLKVKRDDGKELRIPAREFGIRNHPGFTVPNEGDITKHLNDYLIGDHVYHFYGLKHNRIVKQNFEMIECVVCGTQNTNVRDDCINCGYSLIKNI